MRVVVTGSDGDIGRAIVSRLGDLGHEAIQASHAECDVTSTESVRSFLGAAFAYGPINGLVLAHGAPGCIKPTLELKDQDFQRVLAIDLEGTFRVCREAARYMLSGRSGSIVAVSSIHALASYPERAAYAAAKAGVCGLVRALAIEWGGLGVYVNAVLPGQVFETKRTDKVFCTRMVERSPTGSLVYPEMVASAVCFLLTSRGIAGHSLVVDDGWLASAWFNSHT